MSSEFHTLKLYLRDHVAFITPTGSASKPLAMTYIFVQYSEVVTNPDRIRSFAANAEIKKCIEDIFKQAGRSYICSRKVEGQTLEVTLSRTASFVDTQHLVPEGGHVPLEEIEDEIRRGLNARAYPFAFKAHYAGWKYDGLFMIDDAGSIQPLPEALAPEDWNKVIQDIFNTGS